MQDKPKIEIKVHPIASTDGLEAIQEKWDDYSEPSGKDSLSKMIGQDES